MWKFRVWKWCFGFGLDYSLGRNMRERLLCKKNFKVISFQIVIKRKGIKRKRYMLLDEKEFVGVNDSGMYKVLFED
jgi:hypothetical protein